MFNFTTGDFAKMILIALIVLLLLSLIRKRKFNRHRHNRNKSKKILKKVRAFSFAGQRLTYLRKINPFVFEELLLDAFEARGYKVTRNARYTGDKGIDGIVWKDGHKYLVQAKRYKGHVNLKHLNDFVSLVEAERCKGFFCHTGRTGKETKIAALKSTNVMILSGEKLIDLLSDLEK